MLIEGYDNVGDGDPLLSCAQKLYEKNQILPQDLLIKSYQVTFSSTKTQQSYLRKLFNHYYIQLADNDTITRHTYQHVLIASHAFIDALDKSKLYSKVRMIIQPSIKQHPHGVKLHFDIEDKFPYFLSASNEYDSTGTQLRLKFGNKNFLGYHDQVAFEYDKNLTNQKSKWSLNWSVADLDDKQYALGFQQANVQQLQGVEENMSEFNFLYKTQTSQWSLSNQFRYNKINDDDSLMGQYLFRRYIHNLDFLPNQATILSYSKPFRTNIALNEGIPEGSINKFNLSIGIPSLSMNPFLKIWISNQISIPLYEHRNRIKKLKKVVANSSLSCAFNYGFVFGHNLLVINDTFQNINYRGFNQVTAVDNNFLRKHDVFAKVDFKFNIHNIDGLKDKNINLFSYISLLAIGQPSNFLSNIRSSAGIGIAMPIGAMNLEALIPLYSQKQQFDKETIFQIRIATDD